MQMLPPDLQPLRMLGSRSSKDNVLSPLLGHSQGSSPVPLRLTARPLLQSMSPVAADHGQGSPLPCSLAVRGAVTYTGRTAPLVVTSSFKCGSRTENAVQRPESCLGNMDAALSLNEAHT